MKIKVIDNSNPDDPVLQCPVCGLKQTLWDHGCSQLYCEQCKTEFDGIEEKIED